MNKKGESEKTGSITQTVIIGTLTTIIGIVMGYLGTKANAQAQIETAKINIYGPIYTTQTAEAKLTSITPIFTPNTPEDLLLENISQEVYSFQGSDEQQAGKANLRILYVLNQQPIYKFIYELPMSTDPYGSAGLAFRFDEGINVSEYKSLDFTIRFDSPDQSIDLYLVDRADIKKSTSIVSAGKELTNVSFPLINFTEIDLNALKEINFYADTNANTGYHTLFISNIRFVK